MRSPSSDVHYNISCVGNILATEAIGLVSPDQALPTSIYSKRFKPTGSVTQQNRKQPSSTH
eukprot:1471627-Amphidinium_carterae.1